MKRDVFVAGSLRVETARDWNGRYYICADSRAAVLRRSRKEVLSFAKWPSKTPSGDRLREWLDGFEDHQTPPSDPQPESSLTDEHLATGFGPECHLDETDPNHNTKTII